MPVRCGLSVLLVVACITISAAQEKAEVAKVKVEVHLAAEHAPEAIKANSRADLVWVTSSVKVAGKALYRTSPVAKDVEVVSVKREKNPADPTKAVLVELRVTKEQAEKIEKFKTHLVTVVEREGGQAVRKKRPVPLRLELPGAPKK